MNYSLYELLNNEKYKAVFYIYDTRIVIRLHFQLEYRLLHSILVRKLCMFPICRY